jgi:hypothetical protein
MKKAGDGVAMAAVNGGGDQRGARRRVLRLFGFVGQPQYVDENGAILGRTRVHKPTLTRFDIGLAAS